MPNLVLGVTEDIYPKIISVCVIFLTIYNVACNEYLKDQPLCNTDSTDSQQCVNDDSSQYTTEIVRKVLILLPAAMSILTASFILCRCYRTSMFICVIACLANLLAIALAGNHTDRESFSSSRSSNGQPGLIEYSLNTLYWIPSYIFSQDTKMFDEYLTILAVHSSMLYSCLQSSTQNVKNYH
ncbi:unnamed protein product [Moneuplotes crassus]|uniref:Uncharacterized protein n=1 Tax=Euplotes crassus TaxID=5936 RepID=A0AAD1XF15_EUPCR|nr:unnamed protein product [Moneuplotes crassus]